MKKETKSKASNVEPLPDDPEKETISNATGDQGEGEVQPSEREQQLQAELAAAQAKLRKFGVGDQIEGDVRLRMNLGLDREQAIACARRQAAHEEVLGTKYANDTLQQEALIQAASI